MSTSTKDLSALAGYCNDNLHHVHRTVIHLRDGLFLAFGNDGYAIDSRSQREVAVIRERIAVQADEVGFGVNDADEFGDGGSYTWVMLIRLREPYSTQAGSEAFRALLQRTMWDAYLGENSQSELSNEIEATQTEIADGATDGCVENVLALIR